MAHAPFNRRLTAWFGSAPVFGAPYVLRVSDEHCRLVPQTQISQAQYPFTLSSVWLTHPAQRLNGPKTGVDVLGRVYSDFRGCDLIEFDSEPYTLYCSQRLEVVASRSTPSYDRSLIVKASVLVAAGLIPSPPPLSAFTVPTNCETAGEIAVGEELALRYPVSGGTWWFTLTHAAVDNTYHVEVDDVISGGITQLVQGDCAGLFVRWMPDPCVSFEFPDDRLSVRVVLPPQMSSGVAHIRFAPGECGD